MVTVLCGKYSKYLLVLIFVIPAVGDLFSQVEIEGLNYLDHKPISVVIENGIITAVRQIDELSDERQAFYLSPGLFDNQVNGYAGVSFVFGGSDLSEEDVEIATKGLWRKGVTSFLPTLTSNSQEALLKNIEILADAKNDRDLLGAIPGFHLEGPYISPIDGFRGAHPKRHIRSPDWAEFEALYKASEENILTVTIAPELPGAIDFIRQCSELGIIASLGHHNASKSEVDLAVLNGARICTHLGNGCANMIDRHLNPLWPQLAHDKLHISIICDGFHLRDEEIKTFFLVKGVEKTIITSDITSFAGLDPGRYINEDGESIELLENGLLRYPAQNVLYGSATAINRGVVHMMNVTGCTLGEAIQMAATNPARVYNLTDRGELRPGMRADLILFEVGEQELEIKKTYVKGHLVYEAKEDN